MVDHRIERAWPSSWSGPPNGVGEPAKDSTGDRWLLDGWRSLDSAAASRWRSGDRRSRVIDLNAAVQANLGPIVIGLVAIVAILLVVVLLQARRVRRLAGRLDGLTAGSDGASLEAILGQHLERVHGVVRDVNRLEARTVVLERDLRTALGRVGLVRYNPFEDTGGALSFALAILDANGTGFVVSSLHARGGTRLYAKPIQSGRSDAALSDEETEAVNRAMGSSGSPGSTASSAAPGA